MTAPFELSIERLIDAPVAAVWTAWTAHTAEWFCPRPWTSEVIAQEMRVGGRFAAVMHGPAGERHAIESVFLEIDPQRRIVGTDALGAGWLPRPAGMVRIDAFAAEGNATRYTAIARHWDEQAMAQHVAIGFEAGWGTCADQLAEVARRIA